MLPRAGSRDWGETVRAGGAAVARPRSLGRHGPYRPRRRHGSGWARREGHQDSCRPTSRPRQWNGRDHPSSPGPDVGASGDVSRQLADDAFVFSNAGDSSESWFPDSVSRGFKRLCVAEGLPDVRLHDLRHFVASQLLSAGVDVRTVAGRLGHRNAATTLNVYAHFLEQADRGRGQTSSAG